MYALRPISVSIKKPSRDPAFVFQSVFTRKVRELAESSSEMLLNEVRSQLENKRINATGALTASLTAKVEDNRSVKLMSVSSDLIQGRVVESGAKGSQFASRWAAGEISHGQDSGFMERILIWMEAKGIPGGRPSAFKIARSIALKGIPSSPEFPLRHPFTNAQRNVRRKVQRLWAVELDNAIARLNSRNA